MVVADGHYRECGLVISVITLLNQHATNRDDARWPVNVISLTRTVPSHVFAVSRSIKIRLSFDSICLGDEIRSGEGLWMFRNGKLSKLESRSN